MAFETFRLYMNLDLQTFSQTLFLGDGNIQDIYTFIYVHL